MQSTMRLQLVLLGLFCLGAISLCEGSNFDDIPIGQAKRTLKVSCPDGKDETCPKFANCNKSTKECICKEKFYAWEPLLVNCTDMPQDAGTRAALKANRTLTEVHCQSTPGTCPKLSVCDGGECICEDGYVRAEDNKSCKAGAIQVATLSVFPVFISTIILCLRKFI